MVHGALQSRPALNGLAGSAPCPAKFRRSSNGEPMGAALPAGGGVSSTSDLRQERRKEALRSDEVLVAVLQCRSRSAVDLAEESPDSEPPAEEEDALRPAEIDRKPMVLQCMQCMCACFVVC